MGRVVLTFDFELGWGAIENGRWRDRERRGVYDELHRLLPGLLAYLGTLEIPATWAIVGGMLDPDRSERLEHLPEGLREMTRRAVSEGRATTFAGRVLGELIHDHPLQRVASHSYSHPRFSYPGLTEEAVCQDLRLATRALRAIGEEARSFVFPQNHEGFFPALRRCGFEKARGDEFENVRPGVLKRAWRNVVEPPPLSSVCEVDGVVLERGSLFFNARSRARLALLELQARRGLRAARRRGGTLHVYTHPFNLAESAVLFESFRDLLESVARERSLDRLSVGTF